MGSKKGNSWGSWLVKHLGLVKGNMFPKAVVCRGPYSLFWDGSRSSDNTFRILWTWNFMNIIKLAASYFLEIHGDSPSSFLPYCFNSFPTSPNRLSSGSIAAAPALLNMITEVSYSPMVNVSLSSKGSARNLLR